MCRNEPNLDQLLADPIIRLVMSSDGVEEDEIRRLAREVSLTRGLDRRPPWRTDNGRATVGWR